MKMTIENVNDFAYKVAQCREDEEKRLKIFQRYKEFAEEYLLAPVALVENYPNRDITLSDIDDFAMKMLCAPDDSALGRLLKSHFRSEILDI